MSENMEIIEMIVWIGIGFIPTLTFGNYLWMRLDKKKEEPIPWEIQLQKNSIVNYYISEDLSNVDGWINDS